MFSYLTENFSKTTLILAGFYFFLLFHGKYLGAYGLDHYSEGAQYYEKNIREDSLGTNRSGRISLHGGK